MPLVLSLIGLLGGCGRSVRKTTRHVKVLPIVLVQRQKRYYINTTAARRAATQESNMSKYEVSNSKSAHSFGVYEANSPEAAIEAACKDAGYDSKADAEAAIGRDSEMVAVEVKGAR